MLINRKHKKHTCTHNNLNSSAAQKISEILKKLKHDVHFQGIEENGKRKKLKLFFNENNHCKLVMLDSEGNR